MIRFARKVLVCGGVWVGLLLGMNGVEALAQNHFPDQIPTSTVTVVIEDFATIPDSTAGSPPRMNLLTTDPNGRLFVNDQRGPLYTVSASGATVTEYLDLRDFPTLDLLSTSEAGFQSFAFHPDFNTLDSDGFGKFYTIHSSDNTSGTPDFDPGGGTSFHTLLLEWSTNTPDASTFSPADAEQPFRELIRFKQPFSNHNAGLIAFNTTAGTGNTDYGNLYVAIGDGGSGNDPQENGQDLSNPFGALLRIDPLGDNSANGEYGIVSQNVFAADANPATLGEIYAYGLRNPQRFGWDTNTGNMFIADIGQNDVEEIDLGANGANFGWDDFEGSIPNEGTDPTGLTGPVAEYDHTNMVSDLPTGIGNRAVTTGEVARGTGIPGLDGLLPFGDFPTGVMFTLDVDTDPLNGGQDGLLELKPLDEDLQPVQLLDLINAARNARGLGNSSRADLRYGINTPGEVYILNKHDGVLRRLVPLLGDLDGNGTLEDADVNAFVLALTDRAAFETAFPGIDPDVMGDFNSSGLLDLGDVAGFKTQLAANATAAANAVPEPGGMVLLLGMSLGLVLNRRSTGTTGEARQAGREKRRRLLRRGDSPSVDGAIC